MLPVLPDLDLTTPEGRFWHRLTYKPREWVWEHGFKLAAGMSVGKLPFLPPDLTQNIVQGMTPAAGDIWRTAKVAEVEAYYAWVIRTFNDQVNSQDGKEYVHWLVESLKPVIPSFLSPHMTVDQRQAVANHKALPLLTRQLTQFRGHWPVKATITVIKVPGAPPEAEFAMSVHPVDEFGQIMEW